MNNLSVESICGSNFGYWKYSLDKCLDDNAELGISKFDLWGIAPHLHVDHTGSSEITELKRNLSRRGMELVCYTPEQCMYPLNIASGDETLRAYSLGFFKRAAEISSELECPSIFVICGWGDFDRPVTDAWNLSISAMREIAEYSARLGVSCLTETLKPAETNLVTTAPELKKYVDEVECQNLEICIDTGAMAVANETPLDHLNLFSDRVVHCHFVDGTPKGHLAWGDGNLPLRRYLAEFEEAGYTGLFMPEISSASYGLDPTTGLRKAVNGLKEALS